MTKSDRAAKFPPIIPPRQGSIEEPGFRGWGVFSFPPSNRLIITTKKGVYIWDVYGITEIFRSGSEGIVAAKKVANGSEMLAVADSQVVVLHDINRGMQRSYRLKASDGQVRLLKYGKESKNLFFTTTLQNSVQSYSLKHSKPLDPTHSHASPPSVFALSCTSQFLLSTSLAPPTISLTRLASNKPPVLLQPQCSSSAVVAAEFHPERENYFCIAFADGTAAVYDAYHFCDSHGNGERRENAVASGSCGEKAFIRGLHIGSMTKNAATRDDMTFEGYGPGTDQDGIGPKESGIAAVAFVPGRKATVVTVGADGKCCVVDFTQPTKHKAVLLKSWHLRRPATSLSIICSTKRATIGQFDGPDNPELERRDDMPNESYYIAVGRSDGRVLLFDLDGKALGEQSFDDKGAGVIDVEWTETRSAALQNVGLGIHRSPIVKRKRKSLESSAFAGPRPLQMELVAMSSPSMAERSDDPLFDFTTPRKTLGAFHWEPASNESTTAAINPPGVVREGNTTANSHQKPTHVPTRSPSATVLRRNVESSSQSQTEESSSPSSSTEDGSTPPIPPRPNPRPGGRLSMRRAQTSRLSDIQSTSYLTMTAKARKGSASDPKSSKGLPIATHPTKLRARGPRKAPLPKMNDPPEASAVRLESEQPEDAWLDVPPQTPRGANEVSPVSSTTSNKSYKTALSQPYTSDSPERSDDTVVDWTVGLPRQPVPALQITHPSGERPSKAKAKRKAHVSLSVSSESVSRSTPTTSASDAVARPTNRSPAGSPPKILPSLPDTSSTEPRVEQSAEPKQKGHVSLSVSSASNSNSMTPISSASDGPIIQWPSLKKSPRIPDLNKGLPDPKKYAQPPASSLQASIIDSTTDSILLGYAASPSPSPPRAANTSWLAATIYPEPEAPLQPQPEAAPKPLLVSTVDLERAPPSQPGPCTYSLALKSILEASLTTLRAEITQQFEAQRILFEKLLLAGEEDRLPLADQNHALRRELSIVEKGKERAGSRNAESESGSPEM